MSITKKINFNIVLCGFMGTGKTTVGQYLSRLAGLNFIDTDQYIENLEGISVKEIFETFGEKYFRSLEKTCIKNVSASVPSIISTGGGAILYDENIFYLKRTGKIFLLTAPLDIIFSRLNNDTSRPLIKDENFIKKLFDQRTEKYFNCADFIVDAERNINEICQVIISEIEKTAPK